MSHDPKPPNDPDAMPSERSEFERRLLASAVLDVPSAAARITTLQRATRALESRRRQRARWMAAGLGTATAIAAAALLVFYSGERGPSAARNATISAEPARPRAASPHETEPPLLPPCPRTVVASGSDPLIDDFEDGNARMAAIEGRSGAWSARGDGTGEQRPAAGATAFPTKLADNDETGYALRLSTHRLTQTGANLRANFSNPGRCYDAAVYAGIAFRARGQGRLHLGLSMIDVMERRWGGLCDHNCYDQHAAGVDLTSEWNTYFLTWEQLEQGGWGAPLKFDPRRLDSIEFAIHAPDTPSEFWVDDVRFLQKGFELESTLQTRPGGSGR